MFSSKTRHTKGQTIDEKEGLTDKHKDDMKKEVASMGAASSSGQEGSSKEEKETPEATEEQKKLRDQLAIQAIRRAYSQWGKNYRELKGVLDQSQDHKNTKDCKFVGDLCKAMEE